MLFLFLTTPAFGQPLLSPQLDVYDSSGHYSGQPPLIKTISLLEVQECSDVQRTYQDPVPRRVQVLKKLDLVNINVMHCKLALDYAVSYCGWDGAYSYAYGDKDIKHNVVQEIDGDLCHDLHDGHTIEVQLEGRKLKLELKGGKDQETYFFEIKGSKTLNSGCTGKQFKFGGGTYHNTVLTARAMFRIMDDNQETWYSITDKGPQPCKNPHKLSPFTFIWNSVGMGLSWLALSIYDHKTVNSLHHFQNTDNIQGVRHRTTTISIIEDKEDQSFIKGVGNWGEETTNKVLKEIHPGVFSVLGPWTQHVIEIIFLIILAPVVLFLIVVVFRIIMMCIRRKLTLRAMTKGFKATLVNQNDRILASVHRQALISEEEQPEQDPMSNMSDSSEIIDSLVIKTRDLDDQIKELATKLCTAERRIASLVTNYVALTASVTDATRNIGTSASYSNNVY